MIFCTRPVQLVLAAFLLALSLAPARGDEPGPPGSRASIDARYHEQLARLDRERIEALTRLAASQKGGEANATYLEVFRFAIAADRYRDAEPAARLVRDAAVGSMAGSEVEALAQLVAIIAQADRGDYEASMRDLRNALASPTARLQTRTTLALSEAYFRRLVRGLRFDLAREVSDLVAKSSEDPAVRDHFAAYRHRLELVGRPAPDVAGPDADGAEVRLADLKGKVVLVVFWATWCPPCAEGVPALTRVLRRYDKDGFAVLGVNLDTGPDRAKAVRRFLVEFGVPWPNVLAGEPTAGRDPAAAYGVSEIPASVLVGRDGRVITFDLSRDDLLDAVAAAVGKPPEAR